MSPLRPFRAALIIILAIAMRGAQAQDLDSVKTWSVEEFAQRLTDQMIPRVPLSPEQVDPVHKINLKFAGQVMPVIKGEGDQKSKLYKVKDMDRQRTGELEIFLNTEQMRQVRQIQAENRRKMKQRYTEKHL